MSKPKVSLVYNATIRNNGTAIYLNHGFQEAGYEVERFDPLAGPIPSRPFYIYIDDGRDDIEWKLPRCHYYAIDTHLGFDYRLARAKNCEMVWCAQLSGVAKMQEHGILARWLPLACSPLAHPTAEELEQRGTPRPRVWYDLAFVGHLQPPSMSDRIELLDTLVKEVPRMWIEFGVFHEEMAASYHKARIGLNHSIRGDLNMRFFELMSIGVLQMCPEMEGIKKLGFEAGKHYLPYTSPSDIIDQVRTWPKTPYKAYSPTIVRAAHSMVRYGHTYKHRALQIIEDLKEKKLI